MLASCGSIPLSSVKASGAFASSSPPLFSMSRATNDAIWARVTATLGS